MAYLEDGRNLSSEDIAPGTLAGWVAGGKVRFVEDSGHAVTISVEFSSDLVAYMVAPNGQRVIAIRQ